MMAIWHGIILGIVGTIAMDFGGAAFRRIGLTRGLSMEAFDRWLAHLRHGRFIHADIDRADRLTAGSTVVLATHYAIGIALGILSVAPTGGLSHQGFEYFVLFGFATSVFAWCLMFPAMGYGWFGLRSRRELRLFRSSLINHLLYGVGLWIGALVCSAWPLV